MSASNLIVVSVTLSAAWSAGGYISVAATNGDAIAPILIAAGGTVGYTTWLPSTSSATLTFSNTGGVTNPPPQIYSTASAAIAQSKAGVASTF